jgi:cystathionine gamma-synthase
MAAGQLEDREEIPPSASPGDTIRSIIAKAHGPEISKEDVLLGSSGANVFYSLFRTACERSRTKGKDLWIRMGWLYLDTIEVMDLLTNEEEEVISLNRLEDFDQLDGLFKKHGERIAGVVTEFPTNPLLQACDLEKVKELCDEANALLIVDPTMASPKNAKVTGLADVVVNSLTKYAGNEGDVMMGSLVFPKKSSTGRELLEQTNERICQPFERDLLRMAEQIQHYDNFIETTNRSLIKIVDFLESHEKVGSVHWAYQSANQGAFEKLAGENRPGCVASFELKGSFESFYDRLEMLKSPSFGTQFSLCCPYVYLAHYKLMKSETGRKTLAEAGLNPQLLRLSVGTEDTDQIAEALKDALAAS